MKKSPGSPPTWSSAARRNAVPHPMATFGYALHSCEPSGNVTVNTRRPEPRVGREVGDHPANAADRRVRVVI